MRALQHPRVVVIGAGSLFFGRKAIWQMVNSPHLNQGTLALVDTSPGRLERMARLAEMVIAEADVPLQLEAAADWKEGLPGADFVVLSFAERTVYFRGVDCAISAKYGIRMCSGDTIGPGGIFRAMRELPVIMDCARDIERLCPDAWVINYINPSTVNGMALTRFAPRLRSFALCDSLHMPHIRQRYARYAGIPDGEDETFDLRIAGVNHFTWMLRAEHEGRDMMPRIVAALRGLARDERDDAGAKRRHNHGIACALYDAFGRVPVCVGHTKEYVRFWQGKGELPDEIPPLALWETEDRYELHAAMWQQVDGFVSGATPVSRFLQDFGPDHATDIIESMVGGLGKPFYVNTPNCGAVSNMSDDAFLELLCDLDMDGPVPRPVGEMPRGLRGMQEVVLDTHELTAEAVVRCDHRLLRRAMLTDPLVTSMADADAILRELLAAEREALPAGWYD